MDTQLEPFTHALLDHAKLWPGDRVLDIGCGCGASSLDAAARILPEGSVVGVDISRPMLERARERARAMHMDRVTFSEADAQTCELLAGEFDAAISRFGVMFFSDPAAAFANIRRALKPGARLCFVCWRQRNENPWYFVPLAAAAKHIELPAPPDPNAPGPFAFADPDRVRGILDRAGFTAIALEKFDARLPSSGEKEFDRAVEQATEIGPVSALLLDKSDDIRNAVRAGVREALRPFLTDAGVVMDWALWIVSARNA